MDIGDFEQLKQFLRENLVVDCNYESPYTSGNDQRISLSLKGDKKPFSYTTVYIPDDNN